MHSSMYEGALYKYVLMLQEMAIPLLVIGIPIMILTIVSWWKIFTKAGQPGWFALVPILNVITMLKVGGKPWGYFFLAFIPFVGGLILTIVMATGLARSFGKSGGFAAGLIFLGPIFYPILAFGSAQHQGYQPAMQGYGYPPPGYPPPGYAPQPGYGPPAR